MKGWIEVTKESGEKELFNIRYIGSIVGSELWFDNDTRKLSVKETYDELKAKIQAASEGE